MTKDEEPEIPPEMDIISDYEPNLYDIHKYFDNFVYYGQVAPIIGNYEARMTSALVFPLRGVSVVLKGASGSAKSRIIKCLAEMVWSRKVFEDKVPEVLYVSNASSKGYLTDDLFDRIEHRCTNCIIPELQNAIAGNETVESMIKLWTEREAFVYTRAEKFGRVTKKYVLKPLPILTSIASENKYLERLGEEMERRFLPFYTISNKKINEEVHKSKASAWSKIDEDMMTMTDSQKDDLCFYYKELAKVKANIKNPCADHMKEMIPHNFVISNSQIEYWFEIVASITKFFFRDRIVYKPTRSKKEFLISTPADNYLAWTIGGEAIVLACMNIPDLGRHILNIIPIRDEAFPEAGITTNEVVDELSKKGIERTKSQITRIMKALESVSYAKKSDKFGKNEEYFRTKDYDIDTSVNWRLCIDSTIKFVKDNYPEISSDYISKYCQDPVVNHPFTNEKIKILDVSFDEKEEERRRSRRKVSIDLAELDRFMG